MATANHASAQNLPAPVSGLLVLDLAGQPITTADLPYSASFVATTSLSTVTFVHRQDPGFFVLSDVSVADASAPADNLLQNPDFTVGAPPVAGAGVPDWNYFIQSGNLFPQYLGYELTGGGFFDGSTQAYDGIDQTFSTVAGDTYDINFDLQSTTGGGVYQQTSTNGDTVDTGGNGIDALVYAGNGLPPTSNVPDTASTAALVILGLAAVAVLRPKVLASDAR